MLHFASHKANGDKDHDRTWPIHGLESPRPRPNDHVSVRKPTSGIETDGIRACILPRLYDNYEGREMAP